MIYNIDKVRDEILREMLIKYNIFTRAELESIQPKNLLIKASDRLEKSDLKPEFIQLMHIIKEIPNSSETDSLSKKFEQYSGNGRMLRNIAVVIK